MAIRNRIGMVKEIKIWKSAAKTLTESKVQRLSKSILLWNELSRVHCYYRTMETEIPD